MEGKGLRSSIFLVSQVRPPTLRERAIFAPMGKPGVDQEGPTPKKQKRLSYEKEQRVRVVPFSWTASCC